METHRKTKLGPSLTYQFRQPCLGLFLQGGVKSIAIMEMGIQISMLIILSFGMPGHIKTIVGESKEQNWIKYYMRPAVLGYYYFYIITNLFLTRKLYVAASTRNTHKLWYWLIPSLILYVAWFVALTSQTVYIGLVHITGGATWWSFTVYKLYSFWVVGSFIREIKHYSELNFILRKLTDEEIDEFLKGNPANHGHDSETFADKPHNKQIEIDINRVKFDPRAPPLGAGAFGKVLKANLLRAEGDPFSAQQYEPVAVKTVCSSASAVHFKALLSELKILSYIGRHQNIVNLVGACTSGLGERQLFVLVEFCCYGSIYNYLRANRGRFLDTLPTSAVGIEAWDCEQSHYISQDFDSPTILDLIKWSLQTAAGMEYISAKKVIHGDLAARNVLLTGDKNAKIADFGLSHQLYEYSYFTQGEDVPLPWKWMAPEALRSLKVSPRCDIWSFGVTIWEFFTLGATPYEAWNTYSKEFVDALVTGGLRCERPHYATDEIYNKILGCWNTTPNARPSFSEIAEFFEKIYNNSKSACEPPILSYCQVSPNYNYTDDITYNEMIV